MKGRKKGRLDEKSMEGTAEWSEQEGVAAPEGKGERRERHERGRQKTKTEKSVSCVHVRVCLDKWLKKEEWEGNGVTRGVLK